VCKVQRPTQHNIGHFGGGSIRIFSVGSKYSMHNLSCDVISYYASSFDVGTVSVYDKIVTINL